MVDPMEPSARVYAAPEAKGGLDKTALPVENQPMFSTCTSCLFDSRCFGPCAFVIAGEARNVMTLTVDCAEEPQTCGSLS